MAPVLGAERTAAIIRRVNALDELKDLRELRPLLGRRIAHEKMKTRGEARAHRCLRAGAVQRLGRRRGTGYGDRSSVAPLFLIHSRAVTNACAGNAK